MSDGHEVVILEAERLDGDLLRLAEQVSFSTVTRRVTSADSAHAAEAVAREPVAVTCWVQPAVAVSVTVSQGRLRPGFGKPVPAAYKNLTSRRPL